MPNSKNNDRMTRTSVLYTQVPNVKHYLLYRQPNALSNSRSGSSSAPEGGSKTVTALRSIALEESPPYCHYADQVMLDIR